MARLRSVTLASCAVVVACFITGCPGGGDDGGGGSAPPQFSVSPTTLNFSAADPNAATPSPQAVTATVNGIDAGTLFLRIEVGGTAVVAVDNLVITGPNTGQMMVHVASPLVLGAGTHSDTITVIACTTDINCSGPQLSGSPATIDVAYQIGAIPPVPNAVMPSVGTVDVPGEVIIRGSGFGPGTSVTFDAGTAPTSLQLISTSEIRASYPALSPAGPHTVNVAGNTVPFTGSLHLVDPGTLVNATLAYPAPLLNLRGLAYDARREVLIVGAGFSTPSDNQVLRFPFSGGAWQAATSFPVPNLRDFTLSIDGDRLLAITDTTVEERDPQNLVLVASTTRPANSATAADSYLRSIVQANNGQAVLLSTSPNFGQFWLYDVLGRTFTGPRNDLYSHPIGGGPDNGSRVVFVQGGVTPAQAASFICSAMRRPERTSPRASKPPAHS